MRILIAPDKFKGSMSAGEIADSLAGICESAGHESVILPIADGGEGTTEVVCQALRGKIVEVTVLDPLGDSVKANYGVAGKTAIIEMSEASGLWRLKGRELDPVRASTFGTGQMMRDAVENHDVEKIVIGIGGSATNDGGIGMAQALGFEFFDQSGNPVVDLPADFERVAKISGENAIKIPQVVVACDVDNPLTGKQGATRVYGAQKGITEDQFPLFDARFNLLIRRLFRDTGCFAPILSGISGAGAAGGLGFGLLTFCGASLKPGFKLIADLLELRTAIKECDAVITGEGRLDRQTLNGKGPHGVAKLAKLESKKVIAVVGGTDDSPEIAAAFDGIVGIKPDDMPVEKAMEKGVALLENPEIAKQILSHF